jgi:ribose/xylose/arabinose/galactoside ABC-type transport system permease subunit
MMTLGPSIALVPYAERAKGWFSTVFVTIGRVPFFYYLLHVLIIHLSALIVNYFQFGDAHQEFYLTAPYTWLKEEYIWSLPLLYVVFIVDAIVLYFLCKWYASYKQRHSDNMWLKYI